MASQGLRPDVGVLNIMVNMLMSCGLVPTQLKAAQLFFGASRQGQLRYCRLPTCLAACVTQRTKGKPGCALQSLVCKWDGTGT